MIRTVCKCGHKFKTQDIKPPLTKAENGFLGGRAHKKCEFLCNCKRKYELYLKTNGQTYDVLGAVQIKKKPRRVNCVNKTVAD